MIRTPTLKTVPFKMLRPALKTLMGATLMVLAHTYTREWTNDALATKINLLHEKSNALENPTRQNLTTHLAAWYGVALELVDTVTPINPELAALLGNVCKEADWIEPAWIYMREQMEKWQKS